MTSTTPDRALAILVSYWLVASIGWTHGWLCRVWLERRRRAAAEFTAGLAGDQDLVIDLADPPPCGPAPYDWAVDPATMASLPGAPAVDVFEWPGGITVAHRYPPDETP